MKKHWIVLISLFVTHGLRAQAITGSWQGTLLAGSQKLKLVFHISKDSVYQSNFDSPDQNAFGIPCSGTSVREDSLDIVIKLINAGYLGKWDKKNQVSGYYFQNGQHFPMDLTRSTDSPAVLNRPQAPKPPFPYNSENLEYDDVASGIHYSGTITYPRSGAPFPAAILITGSGPEDRDETAYGHKPFAVIADYLTRRGFAVLRVDDRGVGKSTGDISKATSADFARDVERGIKELQQRKDIDRKKIGLIGHSEGGLIAAIAASKNSAVDFIIMLAGPGLKGSDLLAWQNKAVALSRDESEELAEARKKLSLLLFQSVIHFPADRSAQNQEAWTSFLSWKKNSSPATTAILGVSDSTASRRFIRSYLDQLNIPWLLFFLQTDPADYLSQLHCRVLALNGSKDIQVVPDQNLAAIDSALKRSHSPRFSSEKLDGLNHLFQHCQTCRAEEYSKLEETFAPEALTAMGNWLDKNVK